MTKSDYKKYVDDNYDLLSVCDAYKLIDYIFEHGFEDKEAKTCLNCVDEFSKKDRCESDCYECSRNFLDLYESKVIQ